MIRVYEASDGCTNEDVAVFLEGKKDVVLVPTAPQEDPVGHTTVHFLAGFFHADRIRRILSGEKSEMEIDGLNIVAIRTTISPIGISERMLKARLA